jgi:hypothetical protein
MTIDSTSARLSAFHNVIKSIRIEARLPSQVLFGTWPEFYFFESDVILSRSFVGFVHELCRIEQSTSCCLLNFTQTRVLEYQEAAFIFIEAKMSEDEFDAKVREGGPASGWLFGVDHYGCSSDNGDWCLYCERENDVALIGFKSTSSVDKYQSALESIGAKPIEDLVENGISPLFPFSKLTPEWKRALIDNYGSKPHSDKAS